MDDRFSVGGLNGLPCPKPWHPLHELEPEDDDDSREYEIDGANVNAASILAVLQLLTPRCPRSKSGWQAILWKLVSLHHEVTDSVRAIPLSELAEILGCSKSLLSFRTTAVRDWMGGASYAGKTATARKKLAASTSTAWTKRKILGDEFKASKPTATTAKGVNIRARKAALQEAGASTMQADGETPG